MNNTVVVTDEGVGIPYKVGERWCQVVIGNGTTGKDGEHVKICSATEESLKPLVNTHKQTVPLADPHSNCGGVPCDTQEQE